MKRYRIKFEKLGNMRFIGHLDTVALFQRCVKLAQLPISYSKGYHPRQEIVFALPLGLGIASTAEFADIQLEKAIPTEDLADSLNSRFPTGIKIIGARPISQNERSAPRIVIAAEYEIVVPDIANPIQYGECSKTQITNEQPSFAVQHEPILDEVSYNIKQQVDDLLNAKEAMITKKSKNGEKLINIRPLIFSAIYEKNKLKATLTTGEKNLKPQLLMQYLAPFAENIKYTRTDILKEGLNSLWMQ